jgi:hypothetical protein
MKKDSEHTCLGADMRVTATNTESALSVDLKKYGNRLIEIRFRLRLGRLQKEAVVSGNADLVMENQSLKHDLHDALDALCCMTRIVQAFSYTTMLGKNQKASLERASKLISDMAKKHAGKEPS